MPAARVYQTTPDFKPEMADFGIGPFPRSKARFVQGVRRMQANGNRFSTP